MTASSRASKPVFGWEAFVLQVAAEIVEDLQAALSQVAAVTRMKERPGFPIAADLKSE
jgi:hypothetical protein